MKKRWIPLLLTLGLVFSIPVSALKAEDFKQGKLSGLAVAEDGALLVSDTYNKVVWRVDGETVTQYAGAISVAGLSGEPTGVYHDAVADKAYFKEPWDVERFLTGYAVSDADANVVRYIMNGRVYTLAGSGKVGSSDGADKTASFNRPTGLTADADGNLYVSDTGNGSIRRIAKDGKVTTLARGLNAPMGLCYYDKALYVAETGRSRIVKVTLSGGQVTPFAGVSAAAEEAGEYYGGFVDGALNTARFDHPQGIAVDADGTLYVADTGNSAVRAIRGNRVDTIKRASDAELMPNSPRGVAVKGDTLYVTDGFAGSILAISVAKNTFADVPNDAWYAAPVSRAVQQGIVSGMSKTEFAPDTPVNRAMFVTLLSRVEQIKDGTAILDGDTTFSDVAAREWYSSAVRWAADAKIVEGSDGYYRPDDRITREELATMLYRYASSQKLAVTAPADALNAFSDQDAVNTWAVDAMRWACGRGIINGVDGTLQPGAPATRAQAVKMLVSFMEAYQL